MADGRFGLRQRVAGEQWSKLAAGSIYTWADGEEPNADAVLAAAAKLEEAWQRFAAVPEVLRPLFLEHVPAP